jgi:amino acid transporter
MSRPIENPKERQTGPSIKVIVVTSVMLSFISFWRAAAIVLNDLASSAFYAGGIAEEAVGHAAAWFILAVMLFSYAVRAVYIESCAMFTRGGVYRVVKEAMGGTLAKLSVSALMFDYILTGPISAVSAGQYIVGLVAQTVTYLGHPWSPAAETVNRLAAGLAVLITVYFWWRNIRGIHESSTDALRIMYVTTVMVVLMILWSGVTIITQPDKQRLPPAPVPHNLSFNSDGVGWLPKLAPHALRQLPNASFPAEAPVLESEKQKPHYGISPSAGTLFGLIGLLIAFGHSILAMSGEESLAQVNRELEYPKHKNLMRAGLVIFIYSLVFTSLVSFFAYAIIPDTVRPQYYNNLISGIAMNLIGPVPLKLLFQAFIVITGFLILSGAVNTAIIGSNGVLNRVSEDGVLTDWFRAPHRRYGTTYRMINLIVFLQLVTIIGSQGHVYVLGEAYAFGSKALELTDTSKTDFVVMTVRVLKGPDSGYANLHPEKLFTRYEQLLFSRVVAIAEKVGKPVELLVVPSSDIFQAVALTASQLDSSYIIDGRSSVMDPAEQARRLGQAWERLPTKPRHTVCFRVIDPDGTMHDFYLGAHARHWKAAGRQV